MLVPLLNALLAPTGLHLLLRLLLLDGRHLLHGDHLRLLLLDLLLLVYLLLVHSHVLLHLEVRVHLVPLLVRDHQVRVLEQQLSQLVVVHVLVHQLRLPHCLVHVSLRGQGSRGRWLRNHRLLLHHRLLRLLHRSLRNHDWGLLEWLAGHVFHCLLLFASFEVGLLSLGLLLVFLEAVLHVHLELTTLVRGQLVKLKLKDLTLRIFG
jgi:hypothetical protein